MIKMKPAAIAWLKRSALGAAVLYAGLFLFGLTCADPMIFPAPQAGYDTTLPGLVKIPLATGGEAAALWLPKAGAKTAILYLHGNGDDIGYDREGLREIGDYTACSLLAVDYPGYGLTPGRPSEAGCYAATDAAFAQLQKVYGYTPENIVVFGRSLGTGPAVDLVARHRVKGLILISPYTSTFRVVTKVKLLPFDRFDSLAKIGRVRCPLLVVHGDRDKVIPFSQGKELFDAAENASPKRFLALPGVGHNGDLPGIYAPQYRAEINRIVRGE